jgi:hypothetical protein
MLLALAFVVYFGVRVARNVSLRSDWGVYYRAGSAMAAAEPLYTLDEGPLLTFKNAPIVALFFVPLSQLPVPLARMAWFLIDLICAFGLVVLTREMIKKDSSNTSTRTIAWWILAGAGGLTARYFLAQLHCGQTTLVWVLATVAGFWCLRQGQPLRGGALLALAVLFKLVPLCFAPYLVLHGSARQRSLALLGFVGGIVGLLLLPAVWIGWEANMQLLRAWPEHLVGSEISSQAWRIQNQSVYAQLTRWIGWCEYRTNFVELPVETVRRIWLGLSVLTALGLYAWIWCCQARPIEHLAMLLIYMTLFNPLAWRYNFLALFPCFAVVLHRITETPKFSWRAGSLLALAGMLHLIPAEGGRSIVDEVLAPTWLELLAMAGVRLWGTAFLWLTVVSLDVRFGNSPPLRPALAA